MRSTILREAAAKRNTQVVPVMAEHYDALERRDPQLREREILLQVARQVAHAKARAPYFARVLAEVDATSIRSREALAQLPVMRKSDVAAIQQAQRPFGGLDALGRESVRRVFASPGGIYEPEGARPDYWRLARALFAAGFRPGDLVHNTFSYHLTPAGSMLENGAHALGCAVFPAGVGQTEQQAQAIADLAPDGYVGTPSFLKIILDKVDELGIDARCLRKALVSGEAFPAATRDALGARGVTAFQVYATADLGSIAYESVARQGLVVDEGVLVEIVRPGTGTPTAPGEVGEVVVTLLDNPLYPLIRFGTGDLSALLPGASACGRTNARLKGWLGRADQTAKVKGMFVHPSQVAAIMRRHPEIDRCRLVIDRVDQADRMTLLVEVDPAAESRPSGLVDSIREITKLRGEVGYEAPGSLPNDGKVIDDRRPIE